MSFAGFGRMITNLANNLNVQISKTDCRVASLESGALHQKNPRASFPLVLEDSLSFEHNGRAVTIFADKLAESYRLSLPTARGAPDDALFWNGERLEWRRVADQALNSSDDVRFQAIRTNSVHGNFYGTLIGNVHGQLEGIVMTEHQPNITSLGVLRTLEVLGSTSTKSVSLRAGTNRLELRAAPLDADLELTIPPPVPNSLLALDSNNRLRWAPTADLQCARITCDTLACSTLQMHEQVFALPAAAPAHRQILVHEDGALVWRDLNQSFDQTLNTFDSVRFVAVQAEVHGNVTGNLFGTVMSPHQTKVTLLGQLEQLQTNGARLVNQSRLQLCENNMYGGDKAVSLQAPASLAKSYSLVLPSTPPQPQSVSRETALVADGDGRCSWLAVQPAHANLDSVSSISATGPPRLLTAGSNQFAARTLESNSLAVEWRDGALHLELPQPLHPSARATFEAVDTQRLHVNGETSVFERNLYVNGTLNSSKTVQGTVVQKLQRVPLHAAGDLDMHLALLRSVVEFDFAELVQDERFELRLVDSGKFMDLLHLVDGDSFEIKFLNRGAIAGQLLHDDSFQSLGPLPLPPKSLTRVLLIKTGQQLFVA